MRVFSSPGNKAHKNKVDWPEEVAKCITMAYLFSMMVCAQARRSARYYVEWRQQLSYRLQLPPEPKREIVAFYILPGHNASKLVTLQGQAK